MDPSSRSEQGLATYHGRATCRPRTLLPAAHLDLMSRAWQHWDVRDPKGAWKKKTSLAPTSPIRGDIQAWCSPAGFQA